MQSNGGFLSARDASKHAVRTVLSGPAGGVVGALETARASGFPRILGFDMGGTSTDVSVSEGKARLSMEASVDGFPVPVDVAGPDKGSVVVVLGAAHHAPSAYDAICQRLHTASLRTIVIGPDPRLTAKSVVGILDSLDAL